MRILGIDLGSTSIKAVEMDSAFGRYEIHEYHEYPLEPGVDPADAVAAFVTSLHKVPDRVAVSLRPSLVTFRNLQLPTRDKKAIQSGVAFELEDELPFNLDDIAYDWSMLGQAKSSTTLHVAATLRKNVAAALELWKSSGVDPDIITTEAWAYRTYINRWLQAQASEKGLAEPGVPGAAAGILDKPVLLAQIGHERTTLYAHWRGAPVLARELNWGGRDLSLAICQKYNIPVDQAEKAKLDHGFVIPPGTTEEMTTEQTEFSETLKLPLQTLLSALRQAELACKNATQQSPAVLVLSGGTSQLPGLARLIESTLQMPVKPLQALSSAAASGVTYSEHADATFLLAASLALCQVGAERAACVNFRKGDFAKAGRSREINFASLRKPLLAMAAVAACLFLSLFVQWRVYKTRLVTVDASLERSVKSFFGQISTSSVRTYMSNTSTLRASINKELAKQRELNRLSGPNATSPLDFLRELSASVPRDVVEDLVQYTVGAAPAASYLKPEGADASLTFVVANPQVAERLATVLGAKLTGLNRGTMEEVAIAASGTEPAAKKWKITFTGKPTEDSYGK